MYTVSCFFPSWLRFARNTRDCLCCRQCETHAYRESYFAHHSMVLLVYGALNTILLAHAYNAPAPESPDDNDEDQHICQSFK